MKRGVRLALWILVFLAVPAAIVIPRYLDFDPEVSEPPSGTIEIGTLPQGFFLDDGRRDVPKDGKVTVIWFWSAKCKCVSDCEGRIRKLLARFPDTRMRFLAIDSNPDDTREEIEALRRELAAPYEVWRDDAGITARHLGVDASASVAVLDGEGRLRFRGAIDDDLYEPTVSYVEETVAALLAGRDPARTTAPSYGCLWPTAP